MKTPKNSITSKLGRLSRLNVLTLATLLALPLLTARAADISWTGPSADYTNATDWSPASVPGAIDNAINDNGTANAVEINVGDPDWTVGQIRAGNSAGNGAFVQNGQTVAALGTNYNGPVISEFFTPFRLGIVAADTGVYTLNGGTLNYGTGPLDVGEVGTGTLNINGGSIIGSGNFADNSGGIAVPNPAVVTATAGHGPYLGDFTWYQQGYWAANPTTGLPAAGTTIVSESQSDHSYTLAPSYEAAAPDAVILDTAVSNATITLVTPTVCSGLSFVGSAGNGPVILNYTVNHATGAPDVGSISVPDWFGSGQEVYSAGGRCNGLGLGLQTDGTAGGHSDNAPYLLSVDTSLVNTDKVVSIHLTYSSGGGTFATATILGVSGQAVSAGPFTPLAITGYNYAVIIPADAPNPNVSSSITDIVNQVNGAVNITNGGQFFIGNGGTAVYNLSGGSVDVHNWIAIGRNNGNSGGNGTLNMTGGNFNQDGGGNLLVGTGDGSVGVLNQSGGTLNCTNQYLVPEQGNCVGTNNLSGTAVVNLHDWIAIGRGSGSGVLNISGNASLTRDNDNDGGANFSVGSGGPGTINQNGGAITNLGGQTWIGESSTAVWNLNSGTANLGTVHIVQNASATGTLNVNGGSLIVAELTTGNAGGLSTLNLNGGTVQASGDNANFLHDLFQAFVGPGTTIFDSQGYNIGVSQNLQDNGGGGLTKNGSGALTLTGANGYTGPTTVNLGELGTTTASTGGGSYTVANGAGLSVQVVGSLNSQLNVSSLTLGTSSATTLGIDLNGFGNPSSAPVNVTVSGGLAVNGTVTVVIGDALPQLGQFPLVKYVGSMTGSGSFTLGSLPTGMTASLSNNVTGHSIDLVITGVNLPVWNGLAGGNWDIGVTTNWSNLGTGLPTSYTEGSIVLFDDSAPGTTTVNLVTTVNPGSVTITNSSLAYTLVGTGKIGGSGGLAKQGTAALSILNTGGNNYTGPTVISGGTLSVTNLANGGSPSAIGASGNGAANLVFNGGTLSYSGPAVAINRGYSIQSGGGTIDAENNISLSGLTTATSGGFTKTGPGKLAYTGVGNNVLSGNSYEVLNGSVTFDGSAGGQTNSTQGNDLNPDGLTNNVVVALTNTTFNCNNVHVGNQANSTGAVTVDNSTLNLGSWFVLGNSASSSGTFTLNSGTVNVPSGDVLLGGNVGTTAILNINGGVFNASSGNVHISDGGWNGTAARTGVINQTGGTFNVNNEMDDGNSTDGNGVYNLSGGTLNAQTWLAVGRHDATGVFNMTGGIINKNGGGAAFIAGTGAGDNSLHSVGTINQSGGTINCTSEYWIAENTGTLGTNNISGTAVLNLSNWLSIGRGGLGVINFSGGTINKTGGGNIVDGDGGTGQVNQSGGTLTSDNELWVGQGGSTSSYNLSGSGAIVVNNWVAIGRGQPGIFNMSGGSLTKTGNSGNNLLIGAGHDGVLNQTGGAITNVLSDTRIADGPTGTWDLSGGTAVLSVLHIAQNSGNVGTLNLNGGTLSATEVTTGNAGGTSTLNLNGGTLIAASGANANFLHDLTTANVNSNGAIIDSGANTISISQALLAGGNDGGLTKLGSGTLYLNGVNTYTNTTSVNFGALGGVGTIAGSVTVASGAELAGDNGTFTINGKLTLSAGSTTFMNIASGGNDQVVGLTGVTYGGALVVTNATGAQLTVGSVYQLFTSSSPRSGNFSSVTILPAGAGTFNPATGQLTITSSGPPITIHPPHVSGGNLILTGTGGIPSGSYEWLTTTNVANPIALWTTNISGLFDGTGTFSNSIPVNALQKSQFFRLQEP